MCVTSKRQVPIPSDTRENMEVTPAETEVGFLQEVNYRWPISK